MATMTGSRYSMSLAKEVPPFIAESLHAVSKGIYFDDDFNRIFQDLVQDLGDCNIPDVDAKFWAAWWRVYMPDSNNQATRKMKWVLEIIREQLAKALGKDVRIVVRVDGQQRQSEIEQVAEDLMALADPQTSKSFKPRPSSSDGSGSKQPPLRTTKDNAQKQQQEKSDEGKPDNEEQAVAAHKAKQKTAHGSYADSHVFKKSQSSQHKSVELEAATYSHQSDEYGGEEALQLDQTPQQRQPVQEEQAEAGAEPATDKQEQTGTGEERERTGTGDEEEQAGTGDEQVQAGTGDEQGGESEEQSAVDNENVGQDLANTQNERNTANHAARHSTSLSPSPRSSGGSESEEGPHSEGTMVKTTRGKRKRGERDSKPDEDNDLDEATRKRRNTGKAMDVPPEKIDFARPDLWNNLRTDYAAIRVTGEKRGSTYTSMLASGEFSHFVAMYSFFAKEVFGQEGRRRCTEFLERVRNRGKLQLEEGSGNEVTAVPSGSLLEACCQAYQASRYARQDSAIAGRSRLVRIVEFYRSWSKVQEALKQSSGDKNEMEQFIIQYSKDRGRYLAKGVGVMTLAWDWLIDQSYAAEDIATEEAQKSARHFLRDEINVGQRLHNLQQNFGDGIFYFLPSNTPSVIRRWPLAIFKGFIDVLHRLEPTLRAGCEIVDQAIDSPNTITQLPLPNHDDQFTLFEQHVVSMIKNGLLDAIPYDIIDVDEPGTVDEVTPQLQIENGSATY